MGPLNQKAVCFHGSPPFMHILAGRKRETYRNHPTADVLIQTDFAPEQNINTAIPEGLSLWKRTWHSVLHCEKEGVKHSDLYDIFRHILTSNSSVKKKLS